MTNRIQLGILVGITIAICVVIVIMIVSSSQNKPNVPATHSPTKSRSHRRGYTNRPNSLSIKCINLPLSKARKHFMKSQLEAVNWSSDVTFIEAIDGKKLSSLYNGTYTYSTNNTIPYSIKITKPHEIDKGVIGVTLSHIQAIRDVQTDYCLILEDDAWLTMGYLWKDTSIMDIINEAPEDWGIIQLGCSTSCVDDFIAWEPMNYGAFAYIIKKECVEQLVPIIYSKNLGIHVNQDDSGQDFIYSDFFIYGTVNYSTNYKTYSRSILSTYNDKHELDSTIHVDHSNDHITRTKIRLRELIETHVGTSILSLFTSDFTIDDKLYPSLGRTSDPVSLCIPCHYKHLDRLRILLLSLYLQEKLPDEIVISMSDIPRDALNTLGYLQALIPCIPIHILQSTEKQYSGPNRNICIEHARNDLISFIDADDIMHPSRLRIVSEIMTQRNMLATFFHSYIKIPSDGHTNRDYYQELLGTEIYNLNEKIDNVYIPCVNKDNIIGNGHGIHCNGFRISNGHSSIRKSRLRGIRYGTAIRGEDAIFNRTILKHLGKDDNTMLFTNLQLSYYLETYSSTTFNEEPINIG